jgi:integrase
MRKLTLSTLRTAPVGTLLPDAALPGLRYQRRARGWTAQLRWKGAAGWQSHGLGYLPSPDDVVEQLTEEAADTHEYDPEGGPSSFTVVLSPSTVLEAVLSPVREKARELRRRLRQGENPREGGLSLGSAVALHLAAIEGDLRPATIVERRRYLKEEWGALHSRPLKSLTRDDIMAHLATLRASKASARGGGAATVNRARSSLSALFAWALDEEPPLVAANPCVGMRNKGEKPRSRVLSLPELRAIWAATEAALPGHYHALVRLLLLTGARRQEIGSAMWSEFHEERAVLELPEERVKNSRRFVLPLSEPALALLRALPRTGPFVFGDRAFTNWSDSKARLDKRLSLPPFTLHDVRRGFVTGLNELGVEPHVVEACVNHLSGVKAGVAGRYNHAAYLTQKTYAMRVWAEHLLGTSGEAQVITLSLARGAA